MFEHKKLTTFQKEILLAYEADILLQKVKEDDNREYKFICKGIDYCWKWIEKRQVYKYDMLEIIEAEDGYDILEVVKEIDRDAEKQKIYDEFFNIILFIGGRAIRYENFDIPYYYDDIYYNIDYWETIVGNLAKIDNELEKKWYKVLDYYDTENENFSRRLNWLNKSLEDIEPTYLNIYKEEYSTLQKEVLILYVANEIIKELKEDEGYNSCFIMLEICLNWIRYREPNSEQIIHFIEESNNLGICYFIRKEKDKRKKKILQILKKIYIYEAYTMTVYNDKGIMTECIFSVRQNLNYWEKLEEEIISFDKEWKEKLAKVFTVFLDERTIEYNQDFSLREALRKL